MDCIVNFTPTGMIPTKSVTPFVPISAEEIVEQVLEANEIGISMVHLHAREEQTGVSTYRAEVYAEIIEGIRKHAKELIIGVSLSGRTFQEFEKRAEPLQLGGALKPDMGSLTLSSLNFNNEVSLNSPDIIQALAREMKHRNILPELEVFDAGMINYAKYLERKHLIEAPHYFNLIFGNIACAQADLLHAGVMLQGLPPNSLWSMGGVGDYQLMMNAIGIATGGGVRVGVEDNIWYDSGRTRLASNNDLIKRVHKIAEANGRKIMQPRELRKLLHLNKGYGDYGRNCEISGNDFCLPVNQN
jgi:3-keto-5-aminohexanoate cleavage enzyme